MRKASLLRRAMVLTLLSSFALVTTLSVAPVTFAATPPTAGDGACSMMASMGVGANGGMIEAMGQLFSNGNSINGAFGMFSAMAQTC